MVAAAGEPSTGAKRSQPSARLSGARLSRGLDDRQGRARRGRGRRSAGGRAGRGRRVPRSSAGPSRAACPRAGAGRVGHLEDVASGSSPRPAAPGRREAPRRAPAYMAKERSSCGSVGSARARPGRARRARRRGARARRARRRRRRRRPSPRARAARGTSPAAAQAVGERVDRQRRVAGPVAVDRLELEHLHRRAGGQVGGEARPAGGRQGAGVDHAELGGRHHLSESARRVLIHRNRAPARGTRARPSGTSRGPTGEATSWWRTSAPRARNCSSMYSECSVPKRQSESKETSR